MAGPFQPLLIVIPTKNILSKNILSKNILSRNIMEIAFYLLFFKYYIVLYPDNILSLLHGYGVG